MAYYTERHGMRKPKSTTYDISPKMYELLFKCCEKYYNNIAWKYPEQCADGLGVIALDFQAFNSDLQYEIPDLYRVDGVVSIPTTWFNIFEQKSDCEEYDQFSLFDYIEFFAENCKDYENGSYHNFFGHYHLIFKNSDLIYTSFQKDINDIFKKTGLLYRLTDEKIIERIVENSPLSPGIEHQVSQIKEKGIKELLKEAIVLYKNPFPGSSKDAVEKIWDALERLKTYYSNLDKKTSASKIVNDMANNDPNFISVFNDEFKTLTDIGNNYRIRHHETNKIDIIDSRHYDYFFNRCLSLIALALQYLQ